MLRATAIVRKPAFRPDSAVDTVTLDHAARQATEHSLVAEGGLSLSLALQKNSGLEDGDALRLEDGRLVAVRAAAEPLLEVRAENPARLLRLAWQLGGNHVAAEIGADVLYVPAGPSVAELVRGQGCTATPVSRAFKPERTAHDHSTCGHEHHDHGHADGSEAQGHDHHEHEHPHGHDGSAHHEHHDHGHVHGPDYQHDH